MLERKQPPVEGGPPSPSIAGSAAPAEGAPPVDAVDVEARDLMREFQPGRRSKSAAVALEGINLDIRRGETFGLLGPNGAGKTTLVRILSTILLPTKGSAAVCGYDVVRRPKDVRRSIGLVFGGDKGVYTRVSARENLLFWAALYRLDPRTAKRRTDELLERFGLADRADETVERFSRGMRQRLHLARGLITDPPVLFLDEPTVGLDPKASLELRAVLKELKASGRTILLATHDMTEAEALCERVGLIDRGRLRLVAQTSSIGEMISVYDRIDCRGADQGLADSIKGMDSVLRVEALDEGWLRIHTGAEGAPHAVLERLVRAGLSEIRTSKPSLEEVYLHFLDDRGFGL